MTIRKRYQRTAVAFILVLGLLATPAVPAAADEVGGGWTQGITEWLSSWVPWQSATKPVTERGIREELGRSHDALKQQPRAVPSGEDSDPDTRLLPTTILPRTEAEQTCEGYPQQDPIGQC